MINRSPFIILLLVILASWAAQAQQTPSDTTLYHKIRFTSSSVHLVEWNIESTARTSYVMEIIDKKGRTKELRFYKSNNVLWYTTSTYYGARIIRYEYEENKIIETFFNSDSEIAHDLMTSEGPYRFVYHLNDQNDITSVKMVHKIDFEWTEEGFEKSIKQLELYKPHPYSGSALEEIFGYQFAFSKLNGHNPRLTK